MCDDANKGTCQCADKTTMPATAQEGKCCEGGTCTCDSTAKTETATVEAPTQE